MQLILLCASQWYRVASRTPMAGLWAWLVAGWKWLGANSPQMQVIAALAGVGVAAFGVWYARRYVRLTRDLARAARVQAEQARASAGAAADQAHISRQIFEAAHRPSIEVTVDFNAARFFQNADNYMFPFRLHNHGSVPAVLVGWRGTVRVNGQAEVEGPQRDDGHAIFPNRPMDLNFSNVHGPQVPTNPGVEIEIAVQYHSPSAPGVVYTTRMVAAASDNWRATFPELT